MTPIVDPNDDREGRQYVLMSERVRQFRAGEIGIGRAIADLEGLLNALQHAPDHWLDSFTEEWSVLEIAYAVALDSLESLPRATDHDIAEALLRLDQLIAQRPHGHPGLSEHPGSEQSNRS